MSKTWKDLVSATKLIAREGDSILIEAPTTSMAAEFNGKQGIIESFGDEWVVAQIDGKTRRFRADEFKVL